MATKKKAKRAPRRTAARGKRPARRAKKISPIPPQYGSVTPSLVVRGAGEALEFYREAFGARELMRLSGPDGKLAHAEMKIGDSIVMLGDEFPERGTRSPQTIGGTASAVMLYVKDCDQTFRQAVGAGARSLQEPQDMFWGDRYAKVLDPFGHEWGIATAREKVTPRQLAKRLAAMAQGQPQG